MKAADWKIGEAMVDCTFVVPSSVTPFEKVKLNGIISVGIVELADPEAGFVPTIVYGYVVPLYVNDELQLGMVVAEC